MYEQGMSIPQVGGMASAGSYAPLQTLGDRLADRTAKQAQEVGHVAQACNEQERLTSALLDELNMLESRLGSVLRPAPPAGTVSGGNTPAPLRSSLADALEQFNNRISVAVYRLRDIAARADI